MSKPTSDCRATERKHLWPMVRLGDVCGTINGIWKGLRKPFVHVGIIRSSNMTKNCEFSLDKTIYIDVEEKKYKQRKLLAGDIIVERSGGGPGQPVGRAVYFDLEDGEYSVSNFTSILRVKDANALNGKFLQLYLTSQYFQGATENIQSNTTGLHNLDFDAYLNFDVPLPPLSEQKEIVARLERELAAVEKMKKGFESLAETAKAEFKAELKEVFEYSCSCEKTWDEVFNTATGKLDSNRAIPDGIYPFFTCSKHPLRINEWAFDCEALLLAGNNAAGKYDVKHYVGKFNAYQRTYVLTLKNAGWEYKLFQAQLENLLQYLQDRSKGTSTRYLTMGILKTLRFYVPEPSVQREVVARLDLAKARAEKLEAKAREGVAVCETMRKAILKEAFE